MSDLRYDSKAIGGMGGGEVKVERRKIFVSHRFVSKTNKNQDADIIFCNGEFKECIYHISKTPYSLEDWVFLNDISNRIIELVPVEAEKYNKAQESMGPEK